MSSANGESYQERDDQPRRTAEILSAQTPPAPTIGVTPPQNFAGTMSHHPLTASLSTINIPPPPPPLPQDPPTGGIVGVRSYTIGTAPMAEQINLNRELGQNSILSQDHRFYFLPRDMETFEMFQGIDDPLEYKSARMARYYHLSEIMGFENLRSYLEEMTSHHLYFHEEIVQPEEYRTTNRLRNPPGFIMAGLRRRIQPSANLRAIREGGEEQICSICLEKLVNEDFFATLHCDHQYHVECIKEWLGRRNRCPVCRRIAIPLFPPTS